MKRNILYAVFACGLLTACSEDKPSYCNLAVDTESLTINLDEASEGSLQVIEGNGNYKVTSSNEAVATAVASGSRIVVTGLKFGTSTLTITDWAKKSASVKVTVDKEQDLVMVKNSATMFWGESASAEVYTGNGGYTVASSDQTVATAVIDANGKITIDGVAPGKATLTITDKRQKTAEFSVNVIRHLIVDETDLTFLKVGEEVKFDIRDGNGGYTCSTDASASYVKCGISDDGNSVIVKGLKRGRIGSDSKTYYVTVKDREGQSKAFPLAYVDEEYLGKATYRYFVAGSSKSQTINTGKAGAIVYSDTFNMSEIAVKSAATGNYISGFSIRFAGDLSVGEKTDAVLYKITKGVTDLSKPFAVTGCRIDKVDSGWYWVSFQEEGKAYRSYIVTK